LKPCIANRNSDSRNDDNNLGGRYAAQNAASPHVGRHDVDGDGDGDPRGGRLRSSRPVGSFGPEASARSGRQEDEEDGASILARARTYPQGTRRVRHGDSIYHVDEQGRIIGQEMPRRESEPAQRSSSLQALTGGLSQLQIGSPTRQEYPADRNTFTSDLATVDEGKKLNTTLIKGGTNYRDEDLDERK
jgi:hypothetical protein